MYPLLGGYVFCQMDVQNRLPVKGARRREHRFVWKDLSTRTRNSRGSTIVNSPLFARPCPYLNVRDRVRVGRGPLAGVEGILQEIKKEYRLVVSIHLLQRSVSVEVSLNWIKPMKQNFRYPGASHPSCNSGLNALIGARDERPCGVVRGNFDAAICGLRYIHRCCQGPVEWLGIQRFRLNQNRQTTSGGVTP